jgi:hypothetical protein
MGAPTYFLKSAVSFSFWHRPMPPYFPDLRYLELPRPQTRCYN